MTPAIDPDAPWWANLLVLLVVLAVVPTVATWLTGRGTRKEVRETKAVAHAAAASADETATLLKPNHGSTPADAITRIEEAVARVENAQRAQARDLGGIREEMRTERTERRDVSKRLDDHLAECPPRTTRRPKPQPIPTEED